MVLGAGLLLAACSGGDGGQGDGLAVPEGDPALIGALADQIMTDPDLISQNRANNAATFGPQDGSIPTLDISGRAISAAQEEAEEMIGGASAMLKVPQAEAVSEPLPIGVALSSLARASGVQAGASGEGNAICVQSVQYSAAWAAKMPPGLPVYPRAAVQEAAGSDVMGCQLRVVNFLTPVPLGDVVDFYYTSALQAGYSAEHTRQDGDDILIGMKGGAMFVLYARRLDDGSTQADLVTNSR